MSDWGGPRRVTSDHEPCGCSPDHMCRFHKTREFENLIADTACSNCGNRMDWQKYDIERCNLCGALTPLGEALALHPARSSNQTSPPLEVDDGERATPLRRIK